MVNSLITRVCNFFRASIRVIGTLFGAKWHGQWNYESSTIAGWIFFLGVPFGALILGEAFSLAVWLAIVLITLFIINIDDALLQMSNYITYGVDGEVEPYEKVKENETCEELA